jgi:hypothetical protein
MHFVTATVVTTRAGTDAGTRAGHDRNPRPSPAVTAELDAAARELRDLWRERFEGYSVGIEKHGLNPLAVQVMREIGIDIGTFVGTLPQELSLQGGA